MNKKDKNKAYLKFPKLISGILIQRYKRFIADVKVKNHHIVAAHCPNSGSMLGCSEPGRRVYLSRHDNPKRRLKYTWEIIEMPTSLVGINTLVPNKLVKASVEANIIPELAGYETIRSEVKYGINSRIDLFLEKKNNKCFVEVKNCTLVTDGVAYFPDAVTTRGSKHLMELQHQVHLGNRSVMFYLVQRMDAKLFRPADHIDPAYGNGLRKAVNDGVEIIVYDVIIDFKKIVLNRAMAFEF